MEHRALLKQQWHAAESGNMQHYIIGTAGHIDHGKTALVRALTGVDTDRLPEERRRGMTIELGFAVLRIGDVQLGIVDVPGHERFVRTMVAGATGIDIALIVVAADDSVMPQTIEHIEILHVLGVERAVVAVTKIDTVDSELVEVVADDVRGLLAGTKLERAPVCPVSSITGVGIEDLKNAIRSVADEIRDVPHQSWPNKTLGHDTPPVQDWCGIRERAARRPFRMAVDRVFTVQGRGTVVTGSVLRGQVFEDDKLEVWPLGQTCRVRGLQSHGTAATTLVRGQRAAVNVSGIERDRLQRGMELATPGYLEASRVIGVRFDCLSSYGRQIKSTSVVRLEIGTTEVPVRVVLLDCATLDPGHSAYAQLRSGAPLTTAYGQRFIIRDQNAMRTIGGGIVLRPIAGRRRRDAASDLESLRRLDTGDASDRVEEVLRLSGFQSLTELQLCARTGVELDDVPDVLKQLRAQRRWVAVAGTSVFAPPAAVDDLTRRLTRWLERFHRKHPELPGRPVDSVLGWLERMTNRSLARSLLESMVHGGRLKRLGRFACLPEFAPSLTAADGKLMAGMIDAIREGEFHPPALDDLALGPQADRKRRERLATLAAALGQLIQIDPKIYLHPDVEGRLRKRVADLIADRGRVTVADVRETLSSSRKYVVPFLEYLDRIGLTKRTGDHRVLAGNDHD